MTQAYQNRDSSYDGIFYLAVRTTGIFCRPSCPARKPLPQNVQLFMTAKEALFAGYRPCKRCHPLLINGVTPEWVEQLLIDIEAEPTIRIKDQQLRERGLDPAAVRRFFLKKYGLTFHAYTRARRLGQAFEAIKRGDELDDVALGFGYDSHSGFRDAFGKTFGQPPGHSREQECVLTAWIETPLGPMVAGATGDGICLLEFTDRRMLEAQMTTLNQRFKCAILPGDNQHLQQLKTELALYFAGQLQQFSVPVVFPGTAFQQKVWQGLQAIPYGQTVSYQEFATQLGMPTAQRAVGHANGLNRIGIVIPCHRVVGKNGLLGGYGGGLWRKQQLLDLERGKISFTNPA